MSNPPREPKTDEELKQLAIDIRAGKVFTDRHCRTSDEIGMVFMILSFMDHEQLQRMSAVMGDNGMIYEYLSAAGSHGVNGMPSFLSCKLLTTEETEKLVEYARRLEEAEKAI